MALYRDVTLAQFRATYGHDGVSLRLLINRYIDLSLPPNDARLKGMAEVIEQGLNDLASALSKPE
jgi:hypothetical protein